MTDIAPHNRYSEVGLSTSANGSSLVPQTFGDVVAFAKIMASADLALPKHLRNNAGACMAVTMQALRWGMDPFAVASKTYSVQERMAYEAQLVAAVVNTRAPIVGRPNYSFSGEGASRKCKVECVMTDGEIREYETPRFDQILTKNSPLWKADPDQQLGYFAIRSWARRHTPEVIMGVYTPDEVEQFRDVTPNKPSGVAGRLSARTERATEGFSTHNAPTQSDAPQPATTAPEATDAPELSDADFTDATDEDIKITVEVEEPEPAPVQNDPEAYEVEFLRLWADGLIAALPAFKTANEVTLMWQEPETAARQVQLKGLDEPKARDLHNAVLARAKHLAGKRG